MKNKNRIYTLRSLPAVLLLILLFVLPISFIFQRAFENSAEALISVFTDSYTYSLLAFTVTEALLSAAISVVLAIPFAAFFSKYLFPGRKAILTLSKLAFTMPSILTVLGFVIWYGNNGILNQFLIELLNLNEAPLKVLYSYKAIILAHVYLNFPIAFCLITSAWSGLSEREEQASYLMGKKKAETFRRITLPKLKGTIISSFVLIFLFCFSSFAIVLVLGGKPSYYTLEAEIYKRTYTDVNPASSAALALAVFLFTSIILLITSGGRREEKVQRSSRIMVKARGGKLFKAFILSLLILLFLLPPVISIVYRAFFTKDGDFTLKAWMDIKSSRNSLMASALMGIINSLLIALASGIIAVALGERIALASSKKNSKFLPLLASLPMATGSVTLGLGFSFVSAYLLSDSLIVSYLLVLVSHLVIVLPFAVRTLTPGAKRIPESLALASYTLGSGEKRTIRMIERPLLRNYRKRAFAFAFALSLGEVNATLTLSEGSVTTLPILLYRMIGSYNYQGAAALGTILLLVALVIFIIGETGKDYGIS